VEVAYTVYDSVEAIPPDQWDCLRWGDHDLFMDRRLLRVIERSMGDRAKMWFVLFHDPHQGPVASACLSLYRADARWLVDGRVGATLNLLGRLAPWRLQLRLLFCGLPIPTGESCLRIAPAADGVSVLKKFDKLLSQLAAEHRTICTVIKCFPEDEGRRVSGLLGLGYLQAEAPSMYHSKARYRDFDDYCMHLRSNRRHQIRRSQRKFEQSGLRVVEVRGRDAAEPLGADEIYRLYEEVFDRSRVKLEKVSPAFFRELASQLADETIFLFVYDGERIVGFSVSVVVGGVCRHMFVGFDYQWSSGCDLYFNICYRIMDCAYKQNVLDIDMGSTADEFKQGRLSCDRRRTFFYIKGTRPFSSWVIRRHFGQFRPSLNESVEIPEEAAPGSSAIELFAGAAPRLETAQ
jgi:predicted N-acyltransferase